MATRKVRVKKLNAKTNLPVLREDQLNKGEYEQLITENQIATGVEQAEEKVSKVPACLHIVHTASYHVLYHVIRYRLSMSRTGWPSPACPSSALTGADFCCRSTISRLFSRRLEQAMSKKSLSRLPRRARSSMINCTIPHSPRHRPTFAFRKRLKNALDASMTWQRRTTST
jgi:hypothetical protein